MMSAPVRISSSLCSSTSALFCKSRRHDWNRSIHAASVYRYRPISSTRKSARQRSFTTSLSAVSCHFFSASRRNRSIPEIISWPSAKMSASTITRSPQTRFAAKVPPSISGVTFSMMTRLLPSGSSMLNTGYMELFLADARYRRSLLLIQQSHRKMTEDTRQRQSLGRPRRRRLETFARDDV